MIFKILKNYLEISKIVRFLDKINDIFYISFNFYFSILKEWNILFKVLKDDLCLIKCFEWDRKKRS